MQIKYFMFLFIFLTISCSKEIEIANYFDSTNPFLIVKRSAGIDLNYSKKVQVEEKKYKQLVKWLNTNNQKWKSAQPYFFTDIKISQGKFKLLFADDMKNVLLSYVDDSGKAHQYVKPVNPEKLEFLLD